MLIVLREGSVGRSLISGYKEDCQKQCIFFFLGDRIILTINATNGTIYLGLAYEVSHLEAVMSPLKRSRAVAFN